MKNILSDIELRRYSRQIKLQEIGTEGQEMIKNAKVLVIGAGGLGTPVLQYLAAAGVGTLGICDSDYVNETNFHRQIMYGASDLGKLKTIVAKEKLKLQNPLVEFNIHNIQIKDDNAENILKNYQIIIDCSANAKTNAILAKTCLTLNLKLVSGFIEEYIGKVTVFDPNSQMNIPLYQENAENSIEEKGIIGVIPGIIGNIQAFEALKLILNIGYPLIGKVLVFDALNMQIEVVS